MLEIWEIALLLMPSLSIPISIVYIAKSSYIDDKIRDIFIDLAEEATQNEDLQKNLYTIGGLVASGAKSGFGLKSGGGKLKWQDLLMQIAASYVQGIMPNMQPQPSNSSLPNVLGGKIDA